MSGTPRRTRWTIEDGRRLAAVVYREHTVAAHMTALSLLLAYEAQDSGRGNTASRYWLGACSPR